MHKQDSKNPSKQLFTAQLNLYQKVAGMFMRSQAHIHWSFDHSNYCILTLAYGFRTTEIC